MCKSFISLKTGLIWFRALSATRRSDGCDGIPRVTHHGAHSVFVASRSSASLQVRV